MDLSLQHRRALVCGGSQGIGAAAARELAAQGAHVTLLARDQKKLIVAKDSLPDPRMHDTLAVDLGDSENLKKTIQDHLRKGPIHILICNSGGPSSGPITSANENDFLKAFQGHVIANQILVQHILPGMKEASYGRIINIISTSVKTPVPNLGVSNTIRAAVASWAKTLSLEVAAFNITVNNVLPGYTDTDRLIVLKKSNAQQSGKSESDIEKAWIDSIPMKRLGEPSEIANAVAFLASPAASYITGINLPVDGGRTPTL